MNCIRTFSLPLRTCQMIIRLAARLPVDVEKPSTSNNNVCTVCTTGYTYLKPDGRRIAKYGIYFGPNDSRNILKEIGEKTTHVGAMIMAVTEALQLARDKHEDELIIRTDLNLRGDFMKKLSLWAENDFHNYLGDEMSNAVLLRQLYEATEGMDLKVEYKPAVEKGSANYVTAAILADKKSQIVRLEDNDADSDDIPSGEERDAKGRLAQTVSTKWPNVYVGSLFQKSEKGFASAAYASYWPKGECPPSKNRLSLFPITLFRAQLAGIEEALRQATEAGLVRVVVVTDSVHFLKNWRKGWARGDGSPVANKFFYDRIMDLTSGRLEVRFRYEKSDNGHDWECVANECMEGLEIPMSGKNKSEYSLTVKDLDSRNSRKTSKSLPRVRIFKTGVDVKSGIIWDSIEGFNPDSLEKKVDSAAPELLAFVLEQAATHNLNPVIIRTDSPRLMRAAESWLPVWHRTGWRNSLHKPITSADVWKKVWELKKEIKIYWELMEPLTAEDERMSDTLKRSDGAGSRSRNTKKLKNK